MTKTTEENLSQSKYAEHRNVTKGYIGRLIKEGRLHLIKGKLNVAMSDAELDNKSNDDKAPNYWIEKALHEKAKRELAELEARLTKAKSLCASWNYSGMGEMCSSRSRSVRRGCIDRL